MCGIAAIVSGVSIIGSSPFKESEEVLTSEAKKEYDESVLLNIDDLKAALLRRGPDHLVSRKVIVHSGPGTSVKTSVDQVDQSQIPSCCSGKTAMSNASPLETCIHDVGIDKMQSTAQMDFIGATLQLRGLVPVSQPLEDASGNLLVYNGEIFGGINIADDSNDSQVLLHKLEISCSSDCLDFHMNNSCKSEVGKSIPDILSAIKGPWAFIYWQKKSKTMWFGRDAFGRRSMLVHWPTCTDSRFILSSVSPPSFTENYSGSGSLKNGLDNQMANGVSNSTHENVYWEELPCGIYSLELKTSSEKGYFMKEGLLGVVQKHKWMDPLLTKTISWDRFILDPKIEHDIPIFTDKCSLSADSLKVHSLFAQKVLSALRRSVMRRTQMNSIFQTSVKQHRDKEIAPVAILFSGGLDSMILAALLDQCLNPQYIIDLLNVSFDGQLAPDRVSARLGVMELQKIAPTRRWRLVEIDASLFNLTKEIKHVMSLIHPSNTYMDLNIGIALWLAAGGDGWVDGKICKFLQEDQAHYKYKSEARVLLVGSGADEQCAGYGRHRTKYKHGGWLALHEEMRLDMQRIWKRNLGRDDRLISDNGKEARFPFLDEEVILTLLEIPLWGIANLDEPVGKGDKKILREVARLLGLEDAAAMPKRAIQFGSRIARESNRKNFGSNRAANQASAGSVKVHEFTH